MSCNSTHTSYQYGLNFNEQKIALAHFDPQSVLIPTMYFSKNKRYLPLIYQLKNIADFSQSGPIPLNAACISLNWPCYLAFRPEEDTFTILKITFMESGHSEDKNEL